MASIFFSNAIPSLTLSKISLTEVNVPLETLNVLYPLLSNNGVLIVDDYGHWRGSKTAVDEYFKNMGLNVEIHKIDYTGIKIIK